MGSRGSASGSGKNTGGFTVLNSMPKGWRKVEGATTAPFGYEWASNGQGFFSGKREQALVPKANSGYQRVLAKDGWFVAKENGSNTYMIQSRGLSKSGGLTRVIKAYKENGKVNIYDADKAKVLASVINAIKKN